MDITKRLSELDPTLVRHNEGFWNEPYNPTIPGYSSFNDAGIEVETGEFLYAMVRLLKPAHVLETGTHWGIGASYMGFALKENGAGGLDTLEFLPEIHARASQRLRDLNLHHDLGGPVQPYLTDAAVFNPGEKQYNLILLDTEPQTRFAELIKFFPYLAPGGFVFVHDLHRHMHQVPNADHGFAWPYGRLPERIKELVKLDLLRPFHFATPRGLTGFYKPTLEDYNFNS